MFNRHQAPLVKDGKRFNGDVGLIKKTDGGTSFWLAFDESLTRKTEFSRLSSPRGRRQAAHNEGGRRRSRSSSNVPANYGFAMRAATSRSSLRESSREAELFHHPWKRTSSRQLALFLRDLQNEKRSLVWALSLPVTTDSGRLLPFCTCVEGRTWVDALMRYSSEIEFTEFLGIMWNKMISWHLIRKYIKSHR